MSVVGVDVFMRRQGSPRHTRHRIRPPRRTAARGARRGIPPPAPVARRSTRWSLAVPASPHSPPRKEPPSFGPPLFDDVHSWQSPPHLLAGRSIPTGRRPPVPRRRICPASGASSRRCPSSVRAAHPAEMGKVGAWSCDGLPEGLAERLPAKPRATQKWIEESLAFPRAASKIFTKFPSGQRPHFLPPPNIPPCKPLRETLFFWGGTVTGIDPRGSAQRVSGFPAPPTVVFPL